MSSNNTKVVSFINLKGGVGKTSLSVNIAANLAHIHKKRVLFVDLDPQTNGTVSLITQKAWKLREEAKQTLFHMFNDLIEGEDHFNIHNAILKGVSGIKALDLLPSSLSLVEIQDDISELDKKAYVNHVDVLLNQLTPFVKDNLYDYIIIDCPPTLGAITLNGISMSDCYVIPTIPDILSTIGIDLIRNRIDKFKTKKRTCKIELKGVIFTKVDNRTNLHKSTMKELRDEFKELVFTNIFTQKISISEAPIDSRPHLTSPTAKLKPDYRETAALIADITNEFIAKIG